MNSSNIDVGLTHIALPVSDVDRSLEFYAQYAGMQVVHRRIDAETGVTVVWLSDHTRPFAIVLIQTKPVQPILSPLAHLGVGCESRESIDVLCDQARQAGVLLQEPKDSGYPIGYWAFLRDPDGHTLELSYGQEIGLTVKGSDQVIKKLEQQALEWQKSEFQRLEECLLQPELRRSPQDLAALLADDFIEFGSSGRIFDKSQAIAVLQHESIDQFTLTDFQTKVLAADVVLTTYQAVRQDCETEETSISCRSSIWRFVNEQWQVIFHQGTALERASRSV